MAGLAPPADAAAPPPPYFPPAMLELADARLRCAGGAELPAHTQVLSLHCGALARRARALRRRGARRACRALGALRRAPRGGGAPHFLFLAYDAAAPVPAATPEEGARARAALRLAHALDASGVAARVVAAAADVFERECGQRGLFFEPDFGELLRWAALAEELHLEALAARCDETLAGLFGAPATDDEPFPMDS
jgi:hypothetical protein